EGLADVEAVGGVTGIDLGGPHAVGLVTVDAGAAEEAELILAEAVEVRAAGVVELEADLLKVGEVPVLARPRAPAQEILLLLAEVGVIGQTPEIPLRAPVVAAARGEAVTRTGEARAELERV